MEPETGQFPHSPSLEIYLGPSRPSIRGGLHKEYRSYIPKKKLKAVFVLTPDYHIINSQEPDAYSYDGQVEREDVDSLTAVTDPDSHRFIRAQPNSSKYIYNCWVDFLCLCIL
jgi:hypothetical protein